MQIKWHPTGACVVVTNYLSSILILATLRFEQT